MPIRALLQRNHRANRAAERNSRGGLRVCDNAGRHNYAVPSRRRREWRVKIKRKQKLLEKQK